MMTLCTNCAIIWAALWAESDEKGEEDYEFCPKCKSSIDLVPVESERGCLMIRTTGEIIDSITREVLFINEPMPLKKKVKVYDETWHEFRERFEKREDEVIRIYQQLLSKHGNENAWKMASSKVPIVERKYHYE